MNKGLKLILVLVASLIGLTALIMGYLILYCGLFYWVPPSDPDHLIDYVIETGTRSEDEAFQPLYDAPVKEVSELLSAKIDRIISDFGEPGSGRGSREEIKLISHFNMYYLLAAENHAYIDELIAFTTSKRVYKVFYSLLCLGDLADEIKDSERLNIFIESYIYKEKIAALFPDGTDPSYADVSYRFFCASFLTNKSDKDLTLQFVSSEDVSRIITGIRHATHELPLDKDILDRVFILLYHSDIDIVSESLGYFYHEGDIMTQDFLKRLRATLIELSEKESLKSIKLDILDLRNDLDLRIIDLEQDN